MLINLRKTTSEPETQAGSYSAMQFELKNRAPGATKSYGIDQTVVSFGSSTFTKVESHRPS
jgi:hypothetical protein